MSPKTTFSAEEKEELRLEDSALDEGVRRLEEGLRGWVKTYRLTRNLERKYITPVQRSVASLRKQILSGKGGNFEDANLLLLTLSAETLAGLTFWALLDAFERHYADDENDEDGIQERWLIDDIAELCLRASIPVWRKDNLRALENAVKAGALRRRRSALRVAREFDRECRSLARELDGRRTLFNTRFWKRHCDRYRMLGALLLHQAASVGVLEEFHRKRNPNKPKEKPPAHRVELSDEFEDVLQSRRKVLCRPLYLPMLCPPIAWSRTEGGGYLNLPLQLVRPGGNAYETSRMLKEADLQRVFEAVNALQETGWRINSRVLDTMRAVWDSHRNAFPGLPVVPLRLPKPSKPRNLNSKKKERAYKRSLAIFFANRRLRRNSLFYRKELTPSRLDLAERLKGKRFFFPYFLDFRGRAYPVPRLFHPQDDDIGRSLLEFSEGKPLDSVEDARALAVHVANMWGHGLDRRKIDDREEWVDQRRDLIRQIADQPVETIKKWSQAEHPWRFLAACFEWASYIEHSRNRKSFEFTSHMPVAVDGTANGLQHLSALAGDPVGGKWTNLIPNDDGVPLDIYRRTTEPMLKKLKGQDRILYRFLTKRPTLARKAAKLATMNKPYGITSFTLTRRLIKEGLVPGRGKMQWRRGFGLAELLLNRVVPNIAPKAMEVMNWLRHRVVEKLSEQDKGLWWCTPVGFPVVHEYRVWATKRVKTYRGKLSWPDPDSPGSDLRKEKQLNAIVPNFIHSLDAAHMMMTVTRLRQAGLRSFAMVHDSYAVHASDVKKLQPALRETFIDLHKHGLLKTFFHEQQRRHRQIKLRKPPPMGSFPFDSIRNSPYAFC